jgi:hypothetical protein
MQNIKDVAKNVASNPNLWEPSHSRYKSWITRETEVPGAGSGF